MSDFGYDRNIEPDFNTKEGREYKWDHLKLGRNLRQVYIDMGYDGVIELIKQIIFFNNFHTLATKEMKCAYMKGDYFKETMDKFRETFKNIADLDR